MLPRPLNIRAEAVVGRRRIALYALTTVAVLGPIGLLIAGLSTDNSFLGNAGLVGFFPVVIIVAIAHGWASSPGRTDSRLPPLPVATNVATSPDAGGVASAPVVTDRPDGDPQPDALRMPLSPRERAALDAIDNTELAVALCLTVLLAGLTGLALFYAYAKSSEGPADVAIFLGVPATAIVGVIAIWAMFKRILDRWERASYWWVGVVSLSDRMSYAPRSNRRICTLWFGTSSVNVPEYTYDQIRQRAPLYRDGQGRGCFMGAVQIAVGSSKVLRIQAPTGNSIFTLRGLTDLSETGPDSVPTSGTAHEAAPL